MTIYQNLKSPTSLASSTPFVNTDPQVPDRLYSLDVTKHIQQAVLRDKVKAKGMIRELFGTQNPYTFGVEGSGFSGLDCILSMVLPGDKVVAFVNGKFNGLGSLTIRAKTTRVSSLTAQPMNKPLENVIIVSIPNGETISGDFIAGVLAEHQPMWSVMAYCDTSSGRINDIKGFNDACAEHGAMGIIDAVSSLKDDGFDIDEYPGVVAWASCPQSNVLSQSVTYSPISIRHEAIELIKQRGCYPYIHHPILEGRHWGIVEGEDVDIC